ncbi:MAG: alkaline phosphatase family protein [Chloroflexales bacterium]
MSIHGTFRRVLLAVCACSLVMIAVSVLPQTMQVAQAKKTGPISHVLLISVDGLHALDLARYVRTRPNSTLANLSGIGVTYTQASSTRPSDSFPGLLAMVTGGSPRVTGVYYDDSYDKSLSPPGSDCSTVGTEVLYDETIDKNFGAIDGGGGIDPTTLPRDPSKGCAPVYPHNYLRVNTIFEVIKQAGLRTAWSDKHLSYELLNGPSGKGVDDLYTPEIASSCPLLGANGDNTTSVPCVEQYDALKVQAIANEIAGLDHRGINQVGTPAIFGMNFQSVSVAQKLAGNGYADSSGTPSAGLQNALDFVDASLSRMVRGLIDEDLLSSTLIVITAKHGQSPIDINQRKVINSKLIPSVVNAVSPDLLAQATQDSVSLLWLKDSHQTSKVVAALQANQEKAGIQEILSGDALKLLYNDPAADPRTPDIIAVANLGVIYTKPTATKIAEHGGFSTEDTNVALLVANPLLKRSALNVPVQTTQIAPTILNVLGINPQQLQAVQVEQTPLLPGFDLSVKP